MEYHLTSQKSPQPWVGLKGGDLAADTPEHVKQLCCSVHRAVSCVGENLIKLYEARRKLANLPPTFIRHSMLLANNITE